jgi:DNA-binding sugar fermentation-stimulating protein
VQVIRDRPVNARLPRCFAPACRVDEVFARAFREAEGDAFRVDIQSDEP